MISNDMIGYHYFFTGLFLSVGSMCVHVLLLIKTMFTCVTISF